MRVFLDRDEDGHWYTIDASCRDEWEHWQELDPDLPAAWEVPSFAKRLDKHISQFEFDLEMEEKQ